MGDIRLAVWSTTFALVASVVLTACGSGEPAGGPTTSNPPDPAVASSPAQTAQHRFTGLDELFREVDSHLGCPEDSGDHFFMVGDLPTGLPGRQCATGMVMTWSDDPALIAETEQLMRDSGGPVPRATGLGWLVADVSKVAETGGVQVSMPSSTDLESLAQQLGGDFKAD